MKFEIKSWYFGAVLFSMETESLKLCVEAAVKQRAYLRGAYLQRADLQGAYLQGADLQGADLRGAYLQRADLQGADLRGAYLRGAYLQRADLQGAYLQGADLRGAKDVDYAIASTRILPDGDLIVWKKAGGRLVKLRVPAEAKRSHAFGRKCRAEFVDVLEIEGASEAITDQYGPKTVYRIGERVTADKWDDDFTQDCSNGIHFFITKLEAEEW